MEQSLIDKLTRWDEKSFQKETSAESSFLNRIVIMIPKRLSEKYVVRLHPYNRLS